MKREPYNRGINKKNRLSMLPIYYEVVLLNIVQSILHICFYVTIKI